MEGIGLKELSHWINWVQFKIGELLFPFLEPFFRTLENSNPEVKKYFTQALDNLKSSNIPGVILNLNMVLSLRPNHFLARVYRGRLFVLQGKYKLASEDYLKANQISRYRFLHYDLYREYLKAMNKGVETFGKTIVQNFNQAFEAMKQMQNDSPPDNPELEETLTDEEALELLGEDLDEEDEDSLQNDLAVNFQETAKYDTMGPITDKEIEETNWDQLIKRLTK